MKRLINVRFAVVLALAAGLGAGLSYLTAFYGFQYWWLIALVPVTALLVIVFIIKRSARYIVLTLLSVLLFLYGAGGVYLKLKAYSQKSLSDGGSYFIVGEVYEKGFTSGGEYVKISKVTADGYSTDGNFCVYLSSGYGDYCDVGYTISFTGSVLVCDAFAYGSVSSARLIGDIRYACYPSAKITSEYGFSLFGAANSAVRELLFDSLDYDTASVAYAMLTGNTDFMEEATLSSFRYGGVAHVFAVSGLHIGLIFAAITFLLKKLRANRFLSAGLSIAAVFLYSGVCGFTLSSLRAAVMCAVYAAIKLSGGKYDGLSSVSIAFVLLMLINPLNIISVGFQLSVAAVAGISVLAPQIKRFFIRIKIPQKISASASVSISAQIATFPVLLSSFGYVSWASLFLNIIFVPVLSVIFILLFACTALGLVFPSAAQFFMLIPSVPLEAVTAALVSCNAEKALISGFDFGAFAPVYYFAVLFLSDKINLKFRFKSIVFVLLALVIAAGMFFKNYVPRGALKISASAYYGGSYSVLFATDEGKILVISENPSSYDISSLLAENAAEDLDALIILGGEESVFAYITSGAACSDVYVYYANLNFQPYRGVTVHYEQSFTVAGITFTYADGYNIVAEYGNFSAAVNAGGTFSGSCNLLFSASSGQDCDCKTIFYFEKVNSYRSLYYCGDLQFIAKDGKLYLCGALYRAVSAFQG